MQILECKYFQMLDFDSHLSKAFKLEHGCKAGSSLMLTPEIMPWNGWGLRSNYRPVTFVKCSNAFLLCKHINIKVIDHTTI